MSEIAEEPEENILDIETSFSIEARFVPLPDLLYAMVIHT